MLKPLRRTGLKPDAALKVHSPKVMRMSTTTGGHIHRSMPSLTSPDPYAKPTAGPAGVVRHHPLIAFFVQAFGFTWAIELPMQMLQIAPLQFVVGWMPGLAAILVAGLIGGRAGSRL